MALNINGTTGISGVDGSASAPVFTGNDSNTGLSFGTDIVNINTGGTRRINVNSSGQVGIGCDAGVTLDVQSAGGSAGWQMRVKNVGGSNDSGFFRDANDNFECVLRNVSGGLSFIKNSGGASTANLIFNTNSSERMRIHSSGTVGIGTTSDGFNATDYGFVLREDNESFGFVNTAISVLTLGRQNDGDCMRFFRQSSHKGFIRVEATAGCIFGNLSDYRLKENIVDLTNAITRLKDLQPRRFNWIDDETNTTIDGFIAHEAQAVIPEAVTGTKDQVDSDDKPVYQGIDQSKLVPLLTAALQEAVGKIETLETKVAALEAA